MNKITHKKELLEFAIQKQQSFIDDFKKRIKDMQEGEEMVNDGEYDIADRAINDNTNRMINKLADQLAFANKEMATLIDLLREENLHTIVDLGSIVVTDIKTFFVSVSLEKLIYDGQDIIGISVDSPLYQKMKGKRKGQLFSYNESHYFIKEVY
ncbi:MAG: hypothetical protein WCO28_08390 [Bacteroidota bacterium]